MCVCAYARILSLTPTENAHITCSPGAGHYCRVNGDVGMGLNAKRSLSARHREGIHVGYPNSLIQPADTLGFGTPGPALWREAERGPERTFGFSLKPSPKEEGQHGPGIGVYAVATTVYSPLLCMCRPCKLFSANSYNSWEIDWTEAACEWLP